MTLATNTAFCQHLTPSPFIITLPYPPSNSRLDSPPCSRLNNLPVNLRNNLLNNLPDNLLNSLPNNLLNNPPRSLPRNPPNGHGVLHPTWEAATLQRSRTV